MLVVECEKLEKRFGRRAALHGVDLRLEAGRFCALIGPNGAGKSTLIKILMRFVRPSGGRGRVLGVPLAADSGKANHEIGYVSEDLRYRLPLSIGAFAGMMRGALPAWDEPRFRQLLDMFALDPGLKLGMLSRGQRMRYFFALALARRPRLVLIDEIGSVLDAGARALVHQALADACSGGATVLMATNVPTEVQATVDRVLVLAGGALRAETSLAQFTTAHVKLRWPALAPAPHVAVGTSTDGTLTTLAPAAELERALQAGALPDRRGISVEEMVTYYMTTQAPPLPRSPEGTPP
jgi:ABC-2 type transport system ATP-binding protein